MCKILESKRSLVQAQTQEGLVWLGREGPDEGAGAGRGQISAGPWAAIMGLDFILVEMQTVPKPRGDTVSLCLQKVTPAGWTEGSREESVRADRRLLKAVDGGDLE